MKAYPTEYNGAWFRSRLEARWAAFFDAIGWQWEYEPFDGNGYIPDFLIHGDWPLLVEVKPAATLAGYEEPIEKIKNGLSGVWDRDVLIVGASPVPNCFELLFPCFPPCGLLGDTEMVFHDDYRLKRKSAFNEGRWTRCKVCGRVGVASKKYSVRSRPCGHDHVDGHHLGEFKDIDFIWRKVSALVQWHPGESCTT